MKNILKIVLLVIISILSLIIFNKKENTPSNSISFEDMPISQKKQDMQSEIVNDFEKVDYFECDFLIQNSEFPFIKQKGKMYISKPNNMFIKNSILEIGLNEKFFWFWSKHYNPKNLYYCKVNELENSRLKKSLNPLVLKKILSLNPYDEDFKLGNENFKIQVFTKKINNKTVINKKIYKNENLVIETFTEEFQTIEDKYFPKKIRINWVEEDLKSIWTLSKIILNKKEKWNLENKNLNLINIKN